MAGFTYTILTGAKSVEGSIKFWGNHSSIPADQVLTEAQAFIYSRLRVREMIATASITAAISASTFTLPTRFLEAIQLLPRTWSDPMPFVHEGLHRRYKDEDGNLEEGEPSEYTIQNEQGEFDSQLTAAFNATMTFYQRPADLASSSNETNFLTTRYPTLVRYACTAFAYDHRKRRADATEMRLLAMNEIEEANRESDRGRRGQVRMR